MSEPRPSLRDYALIGNGRSAALVSRGGSIDWLCWPRFDSPSVFGAILDEHVGGCWRIAPLAPARVRRAYAGDSNVLVTLFETASTRVRLTDLMPVWSEEEKRARPVPEHEILRIVECEEGEVEIESHFAPRPDYGRCQPRLRQAGALGVRLEDGARLYALRSDAPITLGDDGTARSVVRLRRTERRQFSLTFDTDGPAVFPPLGPPADEAVRRSIDWWTRWSARCTYDGPHRAAVVRSLLTLKLLSYAPSGAIVAAPTTSLPERIGGDLNWDYRYCWLRDASMTVRVLSDLGYGDEASAFVDWLLHATRLTRPELRVLYDVYGEAPGGEELLSHLAGHRGSRPVRIRNAASGQLQLDAYGEVIDAVARVAGRAGRLDKTTQSMLHELGTYVRQNWRRPDQGLWEPREAPREHSHSRLLCWVALDRLLALHARGLLPGLPVAETRDVAHEIREDLERRGWSSALGAYTATLGGASIDASLLLLGWYGFVEPADLRLRRTYDRIQERLGVGPGLLLRADESRSSGEGAFGICCFWAAEYLAQGGGSLAEAQATFDALLACANDVGLYAEEIDPSTREPLGNFPQGFTHIGLVSAAIALEERRRAEAGEPVSRDALAEEARPRQAGGAR